MRLLYGYFLQGVVSIYPLPLPLMKKMGLNEAQCSATLEQCKEIQLINCSKEICEIIQKNLKKANFADLDMTLLNNNADQGLFKIKVPKARGEP